MAGQPSAVEGTNPKTTKRLRWATQKVKGNSAGRKRMSIMDRFHKGPHSEKKRDSAGAESTATDNEEHQDATGGSEHETENNGDNGQERSVYFNIPLPPEALNESGHPAVRFNRNKIRTAKYTPLSFIPKNLWYQFQNIAMDYFLFLIILNIFSIFGSVNPGLNAVPLIVIVFITAVKDAIEDYRRTILDNELNNSPVHRLIDWQNVNVSEDSVSLWRKLKKACSRGVVLTWRAMKRLVGKGSKEKVKHTLIGLWMSLAHQSIQE